MLAAPGCGPSMRAPLCAGGQGDAQFDRLAHAYARALDWVMARRADLGCLRAAGAHRAAVLVIPKNLFPVQDTGQIARHDRGRAGCRYTAWRSCSSRWPQPAGRSGGGQLSSSVGVDGINPTLNQGRMVINLKPIASATARPR
jgi:multidrug efflux pump